MIYDNKAHGVCAASHNWQHWLGFIIQGAAKGNPNHFRLNYMSLLTMMPSLSNGDYARIKITFLLKQTVLTSVFQS
jgi:hypothetical protein